MCTFHKLCLHLWTILRQRSETSFTIKKRRNCGYPQWRARLIYDSLACHTLVWNYRRAMRRVETSVVRGSCGPPSMTKDASAFLFRYFRFLWAAFPEGRLQGVLGGVKQSTVSLSVGSCLRQHDRRQWSSKSLLINHCLLWHT